MFEYEKTEIGGDKYEKMCSMRQAVRAEKESRQ